MSLLAALMLAQAAAPATVDDRIVVMAQRVRSIELSVARDGAGAWQCSLSASSGNARVDEQLCRATTVCARQHENARAALNRCIERRRPGIIEDFRRSLRRRRG